VREVLSSRAVESARRGLRVLYRIGASARSGFARQTRAPGLHGVATPSRRASPEVTHGYDDRTSTLLGHAVDPSGIPAAAERADPELVHDFFRFRGVVSLAARRCAADGSPSSMGLLDTILRQVAGQVNRRSHIAWDTTTSSLRLLSLLSAAELLKPSGRRLPGWDEWLRAFVESHAWPLDYGRLCEPAGNHRFLNAAGVAALRLLLSDEPLPARLGIKIADAAALQFLPDGGHRERTPHYHVQTLALMTLVAAADERRGGNLATALQPTGNAATNALGLMVAADGGLLRFGDAGPTFSGRPVATEAAELLGGRSLPASGLLDAFGLLRHCWAARGAQLSLHADIGPHGIGDGCGHAHADALSFVLFRDGIPVVTDPGTFIYADAPAARWFKLPEAHNRVHWPRHSPYELRRFFHWSRYAGLPAASPATEGDGWSWTANQRWRGGGADVSYRRTWRGGADGLIVTDDFASSIPAPVELTLSFAPGEVLARTAGGVRLERAGVELSISAADDATVDIDARTHAPQYGTLTVVPALVIRARSTPAGASIVTRLTVP
jgi:uncharacterized heparinase superfamily protein